jgi:hypothetical protein
VPSASLTASATRVAPMALRCQGTARRRVPGGGAPHNPFSVGFHAPGQLDYQFSEAQGCERLLGRLGAAGGQAQIVGPPGTGKSTLLHALARRAKALGFEVALLRADRCREIAVPGGRRGTVARALLCLDEADALDRRALRALRKACLEHGTLMLAATHRDLRLPLVYSCGVEPALAVALGTALLARSPGAPRLVVPAEAALALEIARGNMRQALLLMYDWYEERWAAAARR